jgi:hypothetical protein
MDVSAWLLGGSLVVFCGLMYVMYRLTYFD